MSSRNSKNSNISGAKLKLSGSANTPGNKSVAIASVMTIIILYNLLVIRYIYNLEDKQCGCISDWRHDFIKYYSMVIIAWSFLTIVMGFENSKNDFVMIIKNLIMFAGLINLWSLYTYIGDLDATKCSCAIEKQKDMHYFLYQWRNIMVFFLILSLIGIITTTYASM
jgi:hypothetical protein